MRFKYSGRDEDLVKAVDFCNQLYSKDRFWDAIRKHAPFKHTSVSPQEIHDFMRKNNEIVTVHDWTPKFPKSIYYKNTVAVTSSRWRFQIFYHTRFSRNTVASKVNTIVHEHVHLIDYFADNGPEIHFGHPGHSRSGAPYVIGDIAEAFYREQSPQSAVGDEADQELVCASFCDVSEDELGVEVQVTA